MWIICFNLSVIFFLAQNRNCWGQYMLNIIIFPALVFAQLRIVWYCLVITVLCQVRTSYLRIITITKLSQIASKNSLRVLFSVVFPNYILGVNLFKNIFRRKYTSHNVNVNVEIACGMKLYCIQCSF